MYLIFYLLKRNPKQCVPNLRPQIFSWQNMRAHEGLAWSRGLGFRGLWFRGLGGFRGSERGGGGVVLGGSEGLGKASKVWVQ